MLITTLGKLSIEDPFFDSLKEDYSDFEEWFEKKKNRLTYYDLDEKGNINTLLVMKLENYSEPYSDMSIKFKPSIRLKICTFKTTSHKPEIIDEMRKLIELTAITNGANSTYITLNPNNSEKEKLVELLKEWGFYYICMYKKDKVYEKINPTID